MSRVKKSFQERIPEKLFQDLSALSSCTISFSGGTDSSLLVALMSRIISPERVHAVTFRSWLHFDREMDRAASFCRAEGVSHVFLEGPELKVRGVIENRPDRCALCKETRVKALLEYARSEGSEPVMEGSNADDLKDPTRLGTRVLARYPQVLTPLADAGMTKTMVRVLARELGIPWWNENATACLATRFPENTMLTEQALADTARLEDQLRTLGLRSVRLRMDSGSARIEVPLEMMEKVLFHREKILSILKKGCLKHITLDLEGYRTIKDINA